MLITAKSYKTLHAIDLHRYGTKKLLERSFGIGVRFIIGK